MRLGRARTHAWLTLLTLTASFWILGVSIFSAVLMVLGIGFLLVVGQLVSSFSGLSEPEVSTALVIGGSIVILFAQLARILNVPVGITEAIFILITLGILFVKRARVGEWLLNHRAEAVNRLLLCSALSLLVVAARHPWLLPFALPVALLERSIRSRAADVRAFGLFVGIAVVGAIMTIQTRPDRWWYYYQSNDGQFFESLGWSITNWGIFEHPGYVGGSIANYHWFAYAFFGQLAHLARLDPWEALMNLGIFLVPFALADALCSKKMRNDSETYFLVLLGLLAISSYVTDSYAFSILVSFVFCNIATGKFQSVHAGRLRKGAILVLISTVLIFSKVSTAVVMFGIFVLEIFLSKSSRRQVWIPTVTLGATGFIFYYFLFSDHPARPAGFRLNIQNVVTESLITFSSHQFTLQLFVCGAVAARWFSPHSLNFKATLPVRSACIASAISLLFGTVVEGPALYYWTGPSACIAIYCLIRRDTARITNHETEHSIWYWPLLGAVTGFLLARAWGPALYQAEKALFFSNVTTDDFWYAIRQAGITYVVLAVFLISHKVLENRQRLLKATIAFGVSLVLGSSLFFGVESFRSLDAYRYGPDSLTNAAGGNSAPFEDSDLHLVAKYVRENTSPSIILASNNFCCFGTSWWPYKETGSGINAADNALKISSDSDGGANYLLPALTQRRFLIQGLRFQVGYGSPNVEQVRRMTLSLTFANAPTLQNLRELKSYNVSGFIVNLSQTDHRDWSDFAIEKFRAGNFCYLELKSSVDHEL